MAQQTRKRIERKEQPEQVEQRSMPPARQMPEGYTCVECNQRFGSEPELNEHMRGAHGG